MSTLTNLDVSEITRQSDLLSKPVRDNFTNIRNAINDNQSQINTIGTAATNNETSLARPFHDSLKDRLDSIGRGKNNYLKYGGAVTVNAGDTSKVDVAAGEARVNGFAIKWSADTSESLNACAATFHRVDVVVINNAISTGSSVLEVVSGPVSLKASTDPIFPSIAISQMPLAALYIDDAAIDLTNNIYQLGLEWNDYPNYYIKQAATLSQGIYQYNNLIIDAAITIDADGTGTSAIFNNPFIYIKCTGEFYTTSSGTFVQTNMTPTTPLSIYSDGDTGGTGALTNGGSAGAAGSAMISLTNFVSGMGGYTENTTITDSAEPAASLFIKSYNMTISGNITLSGTAGDAGGAGSTGDGGGGGGGSVFNAGGAGGNGAGGGTGSGGLGGSGSGNVFLYANETLTISSTVTLNGGAGGAGGGTQDGGGGGGAAGNLVMFSSTLADTSTLTANGGAGGAAGGGGGVAGTAGGNGAKVTIDHDAETSFIINGWPLDKE